MAIPGKPEKARFFVAILASDRRALALADERLTALFGLPCLGSPALPFSGTEYYREELGDRPLRAFLAYPGSFPTDSLAGRKHATNRLEALLASELALPLPRPVNLDPGYITLAKLVLASAKNYAHRINIGGGIYADLTLQYVQGAYRALPWTFPDYASGAYDGFFLQVRDDLYRETAMKDRHPGGVPRIQ